MTPPLTASNLAHARNTVATPQRAAKRQRTTNIVGANYTIKRAFDVVAASTMLALATPVMVAVAAGIKLSSRGPIFHVQERVGYRGRRFPFIKFRSMRAGNDDRIHREYVKRWIRDGSGAAVDVGNAKTHKLVDDPRVFAFGRFIRKYSIDELPQLFNILKGDMSLVGPRPALPYEVEIYNDWHRRRFEAPPGLTGLWQVSGRNRLTFEQMVELDIKYLEKWSLRADLAIIARTARVVLFEPAH